MDVEEDFITPCEDEMIRNQVDEYTFGDSVLGILVDDVYITILQHLSLEDKKNLKLVSKTCEKRVTALDLTMRTWTVNISGENTPTRFKDMQVIDLLNKARKRHEEIGDFHSIQICLTCLNFSSYTINFLAEWKEHITCIKSCLESIQNPVFIFPNLQRLILIGAIDAEPGYDCNVDHKSVFKFLENHAPTIIDLTLTGTDIDIPKNLKLKKFNGQFLMGDVVAKILASSHLTLQELRLNCICEISDIYSILKTAEFKSLRSLTALALSNLSIASLLDAFKTTIVKFYWNPVWDIYVIGSNGEIDSLSDHACFYNLSEMKRLKCLELVYIRPIIIEILVKVSSMTLKILKLDRIYYTAYNMSVTIDLSNISVNLTKLVVKNSTIDNVCQLLKCSSASLQSLELESCYDRFMTQYELELIFENINFPFLRELKCNGKSPIIEHVLLASQESLKSFALKCPWKYFNDGPVLKKPMQFKQLNKVSVIHIFASEVSLLVKSSCSTLTELVIQGMKEDSPHTFPESNAILNLEFFQCSSLKGEIVFPVIESCKETLKFLDLKKCEFSIEEEEKLKDLQFKQIQILRVEYMKPNIVSLLIKSSKTLERLCWFNNQEGKRGNEYVGILDNFGTKLNLESFIARNIPDSFAATIINASSPRTLEWIGLQDIYVKVPAYENDSKDEDSEPTHHIKLIDLKMINNERSGEITQLVGFCQEYNLLPTYELLFEAIENHLICSNKTWKMYAL